MNRRKIDNSSVASMRIHSNRIEDFYFERLLVEPSFLMTRHRDLIGKCRKHWT